MKNKKINSEKISKVIFNECLWDYGFFYNPYVELWCAVKRNKIVGFFNGTLKQDEILKNKNINVIVNYIIEIEKS